MSHVVRVGAEHGQVADRVVTLVAVVMVDDVLWLQVEVRLNPRAGDALPMSPVYKLRVGQICIVALCIAVHVQLAPCLAACPLALTPAERAFDCAPRTTFPFWVTGIELRGTDASLLE